MKVLKYSNLLPKCLTNSNNNSIHNIRNNSKQHDSEVKTLDLQKLLQKRTEFGFRVITATVFSFPDVCEIDTHLCLCAIRHNSQDLLSCHIELLYNFSN